MIGEDDSTRAVVDSWRGRSSNPDLLARFSSASDSAAVARTEFSATVFSGEAKEWVRYLATPSEARYESGVAVRTYLQPDLRMVVFEPENEDSRWLAELLDRSIRWLRHKAEQKPNVAELLEQLLFAHPEPAAAPARVVLSPVVPSTGTREAGSELWNGDTRFVLHSRLTRDVHDVLSDARGLSPDEKLGVAWPISSRLIAQIAHPLSVRDRFVAKIDAFAKLTYLAINVLYDEVRSGKLVPNGAGHAYEALCSEASKIPRDELFARHAYFRMLGRVSFLLRARPYQSYADDARIVAREYLDTVYLRLSLASAMPGVTETTRPMDFDAKRPALSLSVPGIGTHGVADAEDEAAWKKLARPFRDIGFVLLRQMGIGEFGRVYEALNEHNPQLPSRVALKVDRIIGWRKHAILEAAAAARIGAQLARAPHIVRLYDTGTLKGRRFTYHVLQLIDGDTLDSLIQASGTEHASTGWPPGVRTNERQARAEYERALRTLGNQNWRRQRMGLPFRYPLSAAMVLDVLTSVLLTVEEVHQLGYAINDIKNDNLMMSRRGQIKGIDLDSFSRVHSPYDTATDFMFLAAAVILFMFNASALQPGLRLGWKELAESEERLRQELEVAWPFGDVDAQSDGRVSKAELTSLIVDLVRRCHQLTYSRDPELFATDIARLIALKRRLLTEEFVVD
jgi:hypothetical protein